MMVKLGEIFFFVQLFQSSHILQYHIINVIKEFNHLLIFSMKHNAPKTLFQVAVTQINHLFSSVDMVNGLSAE